MILLFNIVGMAWYSSIAVSGFFCGIRNMGVRVCFFVWRFVEYGPMGAKVYWVWCRVLLNMDVERCELKEK
ncbi:hypothetical protein BU008_03760 [Mammaliicoccus sciuri]|uniref:Uncharacterized protein n=1 Tax=Mammaliicoccus sciuri TaxID=1296 RepID=A0AAI8DGI3_MAMSC|nr:hypothetical protein CEP64_01725 [Mammaliicoccus sciuri]ORI02877.1 hypothetical protein B5723_08315 [Mammaliicoccus sciuri]PTJ73921.1 hypothetical protein BU008_03760 [Mammaliicoccus sciuri]